MRIASSFRVPLLAIAVTLLAPLSASFPLSKIASSLRSVSKIQRYSSIPPIPFPFPQTLDDNKDQRYSASDWYHNIKTLPNSSILREIKNPILAITIWSTLVSGVHHLFISKGFPAMARAMCISSKPHALLVSALGLLLVFRTNSAYQRFAEGRLIWEKVLATARNMSRMAALYEQDLGKERKYRVFRLLAAFPYLLRYHIQPQCLSQDQSDELRKTSFAISLQEPGMNGRGGTDQRECWVDRRSLPWCLFPPKVLQTCAESYNRPLWACDRLSHEFSNVQYTDNFTSRERLTFIGQVEKLSAAIGECERIHQTAVPLNYARHSLRSLTLWLFTLPFAIVADMGLLTGPVMGAISWLLLGVYQIGFTIEDPFQGSLQLSILCDAIYQDVMYGGETLQNHRETAFSDGKEERKDWSDLDAAGENIVVSDVKLP